jgi:hypothetical protein
MIAVPYAPIVWHLSRPLGGAWPRNSLLAGIAAVVITAALGTSTFVLLGKAWFALAGGIAGGLLSWASIRLLGYFSFLPRLPRNRTVERSCRDRYGRALVATPRPGSWVCAGCGLDSGLAFRTNHRW